MNKVDAALEKIYAGRALDVATGSGAFIDFLRTHLKGYDAFIGIDMQEKAGQAFKQAFQDDARIQYRQMDALRMVFEDASFDTVCIANSLHHFAEPEKVLHEMLRVLKPGGTLLLHEMFCDGQNDYQQMHVALHHWWAAIDRADGIIHNETWQRQMILDAIALLPLINCQYLDVNEEVENPLDEETMQMLDQVIDRYQQRAAALPALQQQGEVLRQRLHGTGFASAASLLVIGVKQ